MWAKRSNHKNSINSCLHWLSAFIFCLSAVALYVQVGLSLCFCLAKILVAFRYSILKSVPSLLFYSNFCHDSLSQRVNNAPSEFIRSQHSNQCLHGECDTTCFKDCNIFAANVFVFLAQFFERLTVLLCSISDPLCSSGSLFFNALENLNMWNQTFEASWDI